MRTRWLLCLASTSAWAACSFAPAPVTQPTPGGGPDAAQSQPADGATDHDASVDAHPALAADACIDADNDGLCDALEWPCGALPAATSSNVTMLTNKSGGTYLTTFILSNIEVSGTGQRVVAAPNANIALALHYDITDTACADCRDQIEVGWAPGSRAGCVFDQSVPSDQGAAGNLAFGTTIGVPSTPGVYDLRANIGQNFSCDSGGTQVTQDGWWQSDPDDTHTLARVCVH